MTETSAQQGGPTALVVFSPSGRRGRFPLGTSLLDAARSLGVYVESVCGGRGLCGRCQVIPTFGVQAKLGIDAGPDNLSPTTEMEARYARRRTLPVDRRLGCQALIQGDMVVDIPTDTAIQPQLVRKRAERLDIQPDPAIRAIPVHIAPPDMENPSGDLDRLLDRLQQVGGSDDRRPTVDPLLLPRVQRMLHDSNWQIGAVLHQDGPDLPPALIALRQPAETRPLFGIAVDIGSTTVAAHLVDLATGRTIASAGTANPQVRFGEDLMSRVSYVMLNPEGLPALTDAVRDTVNMLAARVAAQAGVNGDAILEAVFVANPVMHHLFLGIDPRELGGAPFALAVSGALNLPARRLGLALDPGARAYILPCIAGHVGADAAAAILAEGPHRGDAMTLLVDIGTNAEIVLGNRDRLLACSSPTGPAFEGAEISAGQRAAPGAIERVRIDPVTLEPRIRVIGCDLWSDEDGFAEQVEITGITGICGSGIVEAIAEMFLAGILTEDGTVDGARAAQSARIFADGRTFSYRLWSAPGPGEITVTQNDVRAIQLAKAALYAGVRLLMDRMGIERVDRIRLAGAFGSHIDPVYAMVLGLIPDCAADQVAAVGNAAGTGARMALISRAHRREIEDLVRRVEKVETALEPAFQQHFVNAMAFPNKVEPFPELARTVNLPPRRTGDGSPDGTAGPTRRRGARRRQRG